MTLGDVEDSSNLCHCKLIEKSCVVSKFQNMIEKTFSNIINKDKE